MGAAIIIDTPIGRVALVATGRGISRVLIRPTAADLASLRRPHASVPPRARAHLRSLRKQLKRYFAGEAARFDIPLDLSCGTPFRRTVWRACLRIPYGHVRSYAELARMAGRPRAARSVGGAMAANPLPIVVPCHRVIRSDGSLGGYGLGLPLKHRLLRLEGVL